MTDQPLSGRFEGTTHLLPVRVYYEDTDFSGIVYHANYLRFLERGRTDFLRVAGIGQGALFAGEDQIIFVVHKMNIEFRRPAKVDDALIVRTAFKASSVLRITGEQSICRGEDVLVRAAVEVVTIDGKGRPKPQPASLRDALQPFMTP